MAITHKAFGNLLELGALLLAVLLFLTLGADAVPLLQFRLGLLLALMALAFVEVKAKRLTFDRQRISFFLLLAFFLFELLRALAALLGLLAVSTATAGADQALRFIQAPLYWMALPLVYLLYASVFNTKTRVYRFLWVSILLSFFIAMNAIPPEINSGKMGYMRPEGWFFLHPVFYFKPWVAKYILSRFGHPNYTGDVMALGFFSALGLLAYHVQQWRETVRQPAHVVTNRMKGYAALEILKLIFFSLVIASGIFVLFSRGTNLCFLLSLAIFMAGVIVKVRSKVGGMLFVFLLTGLIGFGFWAGNFGKTWKELTTLNTELDEKAGSKSVDTNREGAHRAWAIFKAHPFLGVGTGGYSRVSKHYATVGTEKSLAMAGFTAMCHYLQLLAEEGLGAILYFLMLAVYAGEVLYGLYRTKSRFKFCTAWAVFVGVMMIFIHAGFNHLMQQLSISSLVFLFMGLSLGILRPDFNQHA